MITYSFQPMLIVVLLVPILDPKRDLINENYLKGVACPDKDTLHIISKRHNGPLDCRIVGTLDRWIVGSLDFWIVGLLDCLIV